MENIKKLNLSNSITINYGNNQNFSCLIPIKIPNKKTLEYDFKGIEIKNVIEIIADIKLNSFDCKKKYYPNIEINIDNGDLEINENIDKIQKEMENLVIITDEFNYNKIENQILNLDDDEKIEELKIEQEKYFTIKDQNKYDELLEKLSLELEKLSLEFEKEFGKFSQNELLIKKDDPNYVAIDNGFYGFGIDYVSREFYNYLIQNYKLFKFSRFFTNTNIFITDIVFLGIFFYFYSKNISDYSPLIYIAIFFTLIYFLLIKSFKAGILNKIKKDIININLKEKKYITEKFNNKTLNFSDIFENIVINYNGIYKCDFNVDLKCILKIKKQEGKTLYEYKKDIFSLKLAKYNGNNLKLDNITTYDGIKKLEKIFIHPGSLIKKGFFTLSLNDAEIIYKITYDLNSADLINKSGEIII